MRITIGRGSSAQTVTVPQGKAFKAQPYIERTRFTRELCHAVGVKRT